jgi:hypothetical protein
VGRLDKIGPGWAVVHGMGSTLSAACEWIGRYGVEIIEEVNGLAGEHR